MQVLKMMGNEIFGSERATVGARDEHPEIIRVP